MTDIERNVQIAKMMGFQEGFWCSVEKPVTDEKKLFCLWDREGKTRWGCRAYRRESLEFDSDWEWLIDAVEFIEKLSNYFVEIVEKSCYIYDIERFDDERQDAFIIKDSTSKQRAVFEAVSEFAAMFNSKKL